MLFRSCRKGSTKISLLNYHRKIPGHVRCSLNEACPGPSATLPCFPPFRVSGLGQNPSGLAALDVPVARSSFFCPLSPFLQTVTQSAQQAWPGLVMMLSGLAFAPGVVVWMGRGGRRGARRAASCSRPTWRGQVLRDRKSVV